MRKELEAADHTIEGAQRHDRGLGKVPFVGLGQGMQRGEDQEAGVAIEQAFDGEVLLFAGELDAVFERLAEVFFALETQDVEEQRFVVADDQVVGTVFEALIDG